MAQHAAESQLGELSRARPHADRSTPDERLIQAARHAAVYPPPAAPAAAYHGHAHGHAYGAAAPLYAPSAPTYAPHLSLIHI